MNGAFVSGDFNGFLFVNKPAGVTSHDVVQKARHALQIKKIGHAGTLDPMATGLLILGVGSATKELGNIIGLPKTYSAEITLGFTSTTDDADGNLRDIGYVGQTKILLVEIQNCLKNFIGKQQQIPPQFSAVKINGQRAYKKARLGQKVELKPRTITIYDIRLISYEYPLISIHTKVSSGTYIRALARDIGKVLGCGAYLSKLERTSIGDFKLSDAIDLNLIC